MAQTNFSGPIVAYGNPNPSFLSDPGAPDLAYQGQGIGSRLLGSLLDQGARDGLPVRLSVQLDNRARRLYQRLGFVALADDGLYQSMEWRPAAPRKAQPITRVHHATQTIHPGQ